MEFNGKVICVGAAPQKEGEGKNGHYRIDTFVVETQERYPMRMCFEVMSNATNNRWGLWNLRVGDIVNVKFDCDASEYNGRWYNNIRAYDLGKMQQMATATPQPAQNGGWGQMPPVAQPIDPAIQNAVDMFNRNGVGLQ